LVTIVTRPEHAEYMTKIIEQYQRWGLNVNIPKTEYLNIGSDIQNMKLEDSNEIKGNMAFMYLGSLFTNFGNCKDDVLIELSKPGKQQEHKTAYFGVNIFH
jgi:hypothetical protein